MSNELKMNKRVDDDSGINMLDYTNILKHFAKIEKILKKNKNHVEFFAHTVSDKQLMVQWIFNRPVGEHKCQNSMLP